MIVFIIALAEDTLCIRQTLNHWQPEAVSESVRVLVCEIAGAATAVAVTMVIGLKLISAFIRRPKAQKCFSTLQPLRRLGVSVWF